MVQKCHWQRRTALEKHKIHRLQKRIKNISAGTWRLYNDILTSAQRCIAVNATFYKRRVPAGIVEDLDLVFDPK